MSRYEATKGVRTGARLGTEKNENAKWRPKRKNRIEKGTGKNDVKTQKKTSFEQVDRAVSENGHHVHAPRSDVEGITGIMGANSKNRRIRNVKAQLQAAVGKRSNLKLG